MSLEEYIKTHLAKGSDLPKIKADLKAIGFSDEDVNEALRKHLTPTKSVADITRPAKEEPPIEEKKEEKSAVEPIATQTEISQEKKGFNWQRMDLTKAFVLVGALLIAAAVIVVIWSQWYDVGAMAKILFLAIPTAAIFLLSYCLAKSEHYHEVSHFTMALGGFMLPFTIGTFLCQTKVFETVSPECILTTALISLVIYLLFEYIGKKPYFAIFTVVSAYVALFSGGFLDDLESEADLQSLLWLACILGVVIFWVGTLLLRKNWIDGKYYSYLGAVSAAGYLPICVLMTLFSYESTLDAEIMPVIISGFGVLYLIAASGLNFARREWSNETFYGIKRLFEEIAPVVILLPFLFGGFGLYGYAFMGLVISILFILASTKIWISSLMLLGVVGTVVSVLSISGTLFAESIGWPVVVFITGFAIIGIGLWVKRITGERKEHGVPAMWSGLGRDPAMLEHGQHNWGLITILLLVFGVPGLLYIGWYIVALFIFGHIY